MQACSLSRTPVAFRPACAAQPARRARRRGGTVRAAETNSKSSAEQTIDGLSSMFCDEFECTSSPAVENSVRALARDLQRASGRWTPIHAKTVEFSDGVRRFKGPQGYATLDFVPTNVQDAAVTITGMRMLDNSAAEIRWRLTGRLGVLPIDVAVTTQIALNLVTGRVERQTDQWDTARCSPPAAAALGAARALWAAKRAGSDAGKRANEVLDSITSMDDDEGQWQQPNPNDPMKFFQQKDSSRQDMIFFVGVLALFYFLVQAWGDLFSGTSGF